MKTKIKLTEEKAAFIFIAPALVLLTLFMIYPVIYNIITSFTNFSLKNLNNSQFIGLENYKNLFQDSNFYMALKNTVIFTAGRFSFKEGIFFIGVVPLQVLISFMLALLIQKNTRGVSIFRASYYIPVITSMVVVATVFKLLFSSQTGLVNSILEAMNLPRQPFLTSTRQAMPILVLMNVWKWVGFSMLIFLSGLNTIPEQLYESAQIDGAGSWRRLISITIPAVSQVTLFVVISNTINAFKIFTSVYVMTDGGPEDSTLVMAFYIFQRAFRYYNFSYASSLAVVLLIFVIIFTLVQFKMLKRDSLY
ncbi:MAG: sugar ABC transporter permease [Bacteroidetes bacterium]|nr:sugar ABC transporter permease [Bacteroidota bacterium]